MRPCVRPSRRRGFTLVELLVAMGIILVLAIIGVGLLPRLSEQKLAGRGADLLQGWLLIAKQRALRDRTPTGVRLLTDPVNGNWVRELVYVQYPEDYSVGYFQGYMEDPPASGTFRAVFVGSAFDGDSFTLGEPDLAPVQAGDYLELFGGGLVTQITGVPAADRLTTSSPLPAGPFTSAGSNYRIIRQPRRLAAEANLLMPRDVVIEFSPHPAATDPPLSRNVPVRTVNGPSGAASFREIVFAPSGEVIGKGTLGDKIILYVRDATRDQVTQGEPTLVTIFVRTGLIATHPVDIQNTADFYTFTRDPRSSGL
jgi:prepilin-type N-terminal cleavage/methylation domain-containing protein